VRDDPVSGRDVFLELFDVSRETIQRLDKFHDLLEKWNRKLNLVSASAVSQLWVRHIADSAQIWRHRPDLVRIWLDLGSGAGFPGLVLAALAHGEAAPTKFILVESDMRKSVFLREAAREMDLAAKILSSRIELLEPQNAEVITARALAPLTKLLGFCEKHLAPKGMGLFPKGETVHKEIEDAALKWRFSHRLHRSITNPAAAIVEIGDIFRV
jgi:16S rRNA (guanine527-N7)-methyltransferase